uniref:hypothetical protein n=1 Tax=Syntrophomonas palmitatica TaxID=402877 RepID=UPI0006CF2601
MITFIEYLDIGKISSLSEVVYVEYVFKKMLAYILKELQDILYNHGLIKEPKQLYGLVELRYHGNKLIGWQIDGKEIV